MEREIKITDKLSTKQAVKLVEEIKELQTAEGLSNRTVAGILGCSPAVWSQIKNYKYPGDVDAYLNNARNWLTGRKEDSRVTTHAFCQTSIAATVMTICKRSASQPCVGVIMARSGVGKTLSLRVYAERNRYSTLYIQAGEMYAAKGAMLTKLCGLAGLPTGGNTLEKYEAVRAFLASRYAGGAGNPVLIIIDEATTLHPQTINMLRNLHDDELVRCGVVFADTWRMDREFKSANRMPGGYEQLLSRSGAVYKLAADADISKDDCAMVADSIARGLGHNARLAAGTVTYAHKLANRPGGLRNVLHRFQAVHDVAMAQGVQPKYSVSELDFAATLTGDVCEMDHSVDPFADCDKLKLKTA